jgi:hypothetical protein
VKKDKEIKQRKLRTSKRLILIRRVNTSQDNFSTLAIRNTINKAFANSGIKSAVIRLVAKSRTDNIVLTTTEDFSADFLIDKIDIWRHLITFSHFQKDEPWFKVVLHGVSTADFDVPNWVELLEDEFKTFNKEFKPIGVPYWLSSPTQRSEKLAGSLVVAFRTEEEAKRAIRQGLTIGGSQVRCEKHHPTAQSTQCSKCQGFGHLDIHCRFGYKCRLCAEPHSTTQHVCSMCKIRGQACNHLTPECINCRGTHTADSIVCSTLIAIKAKVTDVSFEGTL